MLRYLVVLSVLGLGCGIVQGNIKAAGNIPSQALLSPEKEMELALRAAPAHLRSEATVYIFGKRGYAKARTGTNGFNCMVNRDGTQDGDNTLHPTCWDPEGSRTIVPVMLRVGELMAQEKSAAEIKRAIDEGFAQVNSIVPSNPASLICWPAMLSLIQRLASSRLPSSPRIT